MTKLNLVSYNVHGLNHPIKRRKILTQQLTVLNSFITGNTPDRDRTQKIEKGVGKSGILCFIWKT